MRPCLSLMTKFITTSLDTGIMANSAACSNPGGSKFPQLFCLTVVFALPAFHLCLPCGRTRAWASPTPPEKAQSARKIGTAIGCPPEMPLQQRGPISYKRRQRALYLQSNMKLVPDSHFLHLQEIPTNTSAKWRILWLTYLSNLKKRPLPLFCSDKSHPLLVRSHLHRYVSTRLLFETYSQDGGVWSPRHPPSICPPWGVPTEWSNFPRWMLHASPSLDVMIEQAWNMRMLSVHPRSVDCPSCEDILYGQDWHNPAWPNPLSWGLQTIVKWRCAGFDLCVCGGERGQRRGGFFLQCIYFLWWRATFVIWKTRQSIVCMYILYDIQYIIWLHCLPQPHMGPLSFSPWWWKEQTHKSSQHLQSPWLRRLLHRSRLLPKQPTKLSLCKDTLKKMKSTFFVA